MVASKIVSCYGGGERKHLTYSLLPTVYTPNVEHQSSKGGDAEMLTDYMT
jgi:hypothetical protein